MEQVTVLARLRFTISLTQETQNWLARYFGDNSNAWFAADGGSLLLSEYEQTWRALFNRIAEPVFRDYFQSLGVPQEHLPFIQYGDSYLGSWEMEAALTMLGTVGTAYAVIKSVSELPELADNLSELKHRIFPKLRSQVNREVSKKIYHHTIVADGRDMAPRIPPPPSIPATVGFVIDARPLRALTPVLLKSHQVHLAVAVSRESFTLENLGDTVLRDVRIGLFKSRTQRYQFNYEESHKGLFPLLSPKQTVAKDLSEFRDNSNFRFDVSDREPVHIDCWVSDSHGIYVFHFFLDQE